MEAEAGHYTLFMELARLYIDPVLVKKRWEEWIRIETGILNEMTVRGDRMH
jgi:tRNA-(ms[2]io[6]A)-hydroxylase